MDGEPGLLTCLFALIVIARYRKNLGKRSGCTDLDES
jgi:hypothetical protein